MANNIDYLGEFLDLMKEEANRELIDKNMLVLIQNSIKQWLATKQRLDRKLLIQYNRLNKEESSNLGRINSKNQRIDISSAGLREVMKKYTEQKRRIRNLREIEDIAEHLKKGYELIHRIREILTGQEITYSILYSSEQGINNGENLLEAHLTIDQVLSNVTMSFSDTRVVEANSELTNAIDLTITNSAVKRTVEALIGKKESAIQTVMSALDRPGLWNSLVDFREEKISNKGMSKYTANMGRIYEVYSVLRRVDKYKSINYIGKGPKGNTENLAETLLRDAIENTDPGWQIGDVGLEQLKAVFNANASLINTSTIEKILTEVQEGLKADSPEELGEKMKSIFTTQRTDFNNKLDQKVEQEAIQAIEKGVEKFFHLTT